jgi:pimeloyl-ACP methyl ester carboxylesterase
MNHSAVNRMAKSAGLALALGGLLASPLMAQRKAAQEKTAHGKTAKAAAGVAGDWSGTLNAGGVQLRLVVHFTPKPGGGLAGTLDSIDQPGSNGLPFSLVRQTGAMVHAESALIHAVFDGTLDGAGKTITGHWTQTVPLPLTLTRMTAAMRAALGRNDRPQEPKPPYPYTSEDVSFPGGAAGVTLAGTLTLPLASTGENGPSPAAVLISGSGPNDRDETILRHKLFLVLADSLTRRGIAVLRYDKRGIGKSTGSYAQATSADFAADAGAAFAYLRTRPQVNARKIGLIGHSEGGLIAPMVAAKSPDVAFLVLLAGTGIPGERIIAEQSALIGHAEGASDADVAKSQVMEKKLLAVAAHETDPAAARTQIQALMRQAMATMTPAQKKTMGDPAPLIRAQSAALASPWFHFFLTYDPAPTLKQVHCPVLALDGSLDLQVPPSENLAAIGAALKAGGAADVTTTELPGLNHLFQTAKTGSPSEYGRIEETLAPVLLTTVGDWIAAREK